MASWRVDSLCRGKRKAIAASPAAGHERTAQHALQPAPPGSVKLGSATTRTAVEVVGIVTGARPVRLPLATAGFGWRKAGGVACRRRPDFTREQAQASATCALTEFVAERARKPMP